MKPKYFLAACLWTAVLTSHAQNAALPLWEVGVFSGIASTPAYPGSAERASRGLVLPLFIYRGEIFRSDNAGVGARVLRTDDVELDVGFSGALPASSEAIAARSGMPDLGTLVEFGPRLKWTIARPSADSLVRLELPLRTVLEFNGGVRGQGAAFEPTLTHSTRDIGAGWSLSTKASLVYGDARLNGYFYGVDAQYATAARPVFDAKAGLIAARLAFSGSKNLTPNLRVFGFVRMESYADGANRQSPLHLAASGTGAGLGLTWILGRSDSRAFD